MIQSTIIAYALIEMLVPLTLHPNTVVEDKTFIKTFSRDVESCANFDLAKERRMFMAQFANNKAVKLLAVNMECVDIDRADFFIGDPV